MSKIAKAVQRAIEAGEPVPVIRDDGRIMAYVSVPNKPLSPGWCCEEHAADVSARLSRAEIERDIAVRFLRDLCEDVPAVQEFLTQLDAQKSDTDGEDQC